MRNYSLFQELNDDEYNKLLTIFKTKKIDKDTILIKENENGSSAFFLLAGKVSILKETIYGEDYIVTIIDSNGEEFFGEVNLIDNGKRTSTITAVEDCEILEVNSDDLKVFMDNNPVIGYKIMTYLAKACAKHLRKADNDVITLFNALVEVVEND